MKIPKNINMKHSYNEQDTYLEILELLYTKTDISFVLAGDGSIYINDFISYFKDRRVALVTPSSSILEDIAFYPSDDDCGLCSILLIEDYIYNKILKRVFQIFTKHFFIQVKGDNKISTDTEEPLIYLKQESLYRKIDHIFSISKNSNYCRGIIDLDISIDSVTFCGKVMLNHSFYNHLSKPNQNSFYNIEFTNKEKNTFLDIYQNHILKYFQDNLDMLQ